MRNSLKPFLDSIGLKAGDTVASVGAASGNIEVCYATFTEGVTYYLQDINWGVLQKKIIKRQIRYYAQFSEMVETNAFERQIGRKQETRLPDNTFDVIFLSNTYHEFKYPSEMLQDIQLKLKEGGRFVVSDHFRQSQDAERLVYNCAHDVPEIISTLALMNENNLYLSRMFYPASAGFNVLIFTKDSSGKGKDIELKKKTTLLDSVYTLASKLTDTSALYDGTTYESLHTLMSENSGYLTTHPHTALEEMLKQAGLYYNANKNRQAAIKVLALWNEFYYELLHTSLLSQLYEKEKMYKKAYDTWLKVLENDPQALRVGQARKRYRVLGRKVE